ncbi:aminodeoxychorismate lyase [Williamsia sterculiae]|uniref:4-amino-4-deoxychorismate lyase n=1 Tax=Williamsia sterculiae TaxID=1344003 RepID=A0A1N7GXE6_9NOCA|nr:aminodeoxychorismate lyase [Williamsia sterculiae]SIS17239.1 4-amino-4-deoxychorismate lyase [Williamsia sterculiae]
MPDPILVTLDGAVLDPNVPLLYADDLAAVRGDGVFETLLVRDGTARCVDRHLDRLDRSAKALDLPAPDLDRWRSAIETGQRVWAQRWGGDREGMMRVVYSRGRESAPVDAVARARSSETGISRESNEATAYLTVAPVPQRAFDVRAGGVSVLTAQRGYSIDLASAAPWQLYGAKTLSYATNMAALRWAAEQGADDVIYLSAEGAVLESPRSTVITVRGDTLATPPPESGILAGTTQQAVFALAEKEGWRTSTERLRTPDLIAADAVWLVSSVTLAARVTALNGYRMPTPERPGEFADLVDRAILAG